MGDFTPKKVASGIKEKMDQLASPPKVQQNRKERGAEGSSSSQKPPPKDKQRATSPDQPATELTLGQAAQLVMERILELKNHPDSRSCP